MQIDMNMLIDKEFGGVEHYADLRKISGVTRRKWRQRGGVPLSELGPALLVLEADRGCPLSLIPYVRGDDTCSRTKRGTTGEPPSVFD